MEDKIKNISNDKKEKENKIKENKESLMLLAILPLEELKWTSKYLLRILDSLDIINNKSS